MLTKIALIRSRLNAISSYPWKPIVDLDAIPPKDRIESSLGVMICKGASDISPLDMSADDCRFIANAPSDVEFLLDTLEEYMAKYKQASENTTINITLNKESL